MPTQNYFVELSGLDSNTGTSQAAAFASLLKAKTVAASGDTVFVGTSSTTTPFNTLQSSASFANGVIVQGAGQTETFVTGNPSLDLSAGPIFWSQFADGMTIYGRRITDPLAASSAVLGWTGNPFVGRNMPTQQTYSNLTLIGNQDVFFWGAENQSTNSVYQITMSNIVTDTNWDTLRANSYIGDRNTARNGTFNIDIYTSTMAGIGVPPDGLSVNGPVSEMGRIRVYNSSMKFLNGTGAIGLSTAPPRGTAEAYNCRFQTTTDGDPFSNAWDVANFSSGGLFQVTDSVFNSSTGTITQVNAMAYTINPAGGADFTSINDAIADAGVQATVGALVFQLTGVGGHMGASTVTLDWDSFPLVTSFSMTAVGHRATYGIQADNAVACIDGTLNFTTSAILNTAFTSATVDGIQWGTSTVKGIMVADEMGAAGAFTTCTVQNCMIAEQVTLGTGTGLRNILHFKASVDGIGGTVTANVINVGLSSPFAQTSTNLRPLLFQSDAAYTMNANVYQCSCDLKNLTRFIGRIYPSTSTLNLDVRYNVAVGVADTAVFINDITTGGTATVNPSSDYNVMGADAGAAYGTHRISGKTRADCWTLSAGLEYGLLLNGPATGISQTSTLIPTDIVGVARPQNGFFDAGIMETPHTPTPATGGGVANNNDSLLVLEVY